MKFPTEWKNNPNIPNHQPGHQYSYKWLLYQLNITSGIIYQLRPITGYKLVLNGIIRSINGVISYKYL